MFKLIYSERFQNQIYTRYDLKFPEEDYFYVEDNIFCVADGVTRDLKGGEVRPYPQTREDAEYIAQHYPNPSGSLDSSKIIANNFVKYLKENLDYIDEEQIKNAVRRANKDIWEINKDREIDYVGEDLYCSEAVGGVILGDFLYCFGIGDCYIKVFDEQYNELFSTENDHEWMEEFENDCLKSGEYNWMDPRYRLLIRGALRNNFIITHNGKKAGYGALTGEDSAMDFVKTYKVPLNNVKYIVAYSDGCIPYFENKSEAEQSLKNLDRIKEDGSERTLVIYEKEM
ncbi:MAG: protein phosphatase 2C domain-containing protein [Clostridia bacterium]|nr:protein phosphatase 2C domain-containing protein [Clostridia bacterium]